MQKNRHLLLLKIFSWIILKTCISYATMNFSQTFLRNLYRVSYTNNFYLSLFLPIDGYYWVILSKGGE